MSQPQTISAKVSQKGLKKISLFFNQSNLTLLGELLQNSRRAGATQIDINIQEAGKFTKVTLLDNGRGIEQPGALLELFESGWDNEIQGNESPAGLGFFSLCHLEKGVTVRSKDWQTHIQKSDFESGAEIPLLPKSHLTGTSLTFHLPEKIETVRRTIEEIGLHYPVSIRLNRKNIPQKDFLSNAAFVLAVPGGRIGVCTDYNPHSHDDLVDINFHGVKLTAKIPCPQPGWYIKVDVAENTLLDLVLPARNAVIENQKLTDLQAEARRAVYTYIAAGGNGHGHDMPFENWIEAGSLGISIPEANPSLRRIRAGSVWDDLCCRGDYFGEDKVKPTAESAINHLTASEALILELAAGEFPVLFEENPQKAGYSWYPKNKTNGVRQILTHKGKTYSFPTEGFSNEENEIWENLSAKNARPVKIEVVFEISGPNKSAARHRAFIAANCEDSGDECLNHAWIPVRGKKATENINSDVLADLFFSFSSDYDTDSYDSQKEDFTKKAEEEIIARLFGEKKAALHKANAVFTGFEAREAMEGLGVERIVLVLDQNGYPKIESTTPAKKRKKK